MNIRDKQDALTLEILEAIEREEQVTQRHLARRLGVALGLANSYLRRCVRKGLVKVQQAPANRYLYYLTPKGFAEKGRLTAEYLSYSLSFYRRAGESCDRVFGQCAARGWSRTVLYGASDLAEIAAIRAAPHRVTVVAVVDPETDGDARVHGIPVLGALPGPDGFDACVLTALKDPAGQLARLAGQVEPVRLLVPDILGLTGPGVGRR